jgi:hypothetical protein
MSSEVVLDMSEPGLGDERNPPQLVLLGFAFRVALHTTQWDMA